MPEAGVDYPAHYGDFLEWFGTDEACLEYLDWLRWPGECFVCPYCRGAKRWRIGSRWRCAGCRTWVSAASGMLFPGTRLPLTIWFHATWRMATSKSGASALELQRMLGISNYQSVWSMQFRLRQPMGAGAKERLGGTAEVDETFFGGSRSGIRGRGALGKVMVAVDVDHAGTGRLGRTRMLVLSNANASTLAAFLASAVEPGATVVTDGFKPYRTATSGYAHEVHVVQGSGAHAHKLLPAVHRVIALTKRRIAATHQGGIQPQHRPAHLDEFVFRFNRRKSRAPGLIFYRLLQAMVSTAPTARKVAEAGPATKGVPPKTTAGSHHDPRPLVLMRRESPWREGPSNG